MKKKVKKRWKREIKNGKPNWWIIEFEHSDEEPIINFEIREKLPKFKYGCPVRTKIAQKMIKKIGYQADYHDSDDFIVEEIIQVGMNAEIWSLGS